MADAGQSPVTPIDGEIVAVSPKSPVLMESVQRSDAASALDMSAPVNGGSGNKKNVTAASQQARIGNVSKFHQFRTPQQCVQLKKKTWNKRQKCHHHMKYLHHTHQLQQQQLHHQQQQQSAACKADLENIQSNKNPIGHHRIPAGMCAACGVEAGNNNSLQCKNSKQQIYKKLLSHRPCTGGVGGCSACNGVVNNVNGGAPPLAHHPLFCSRSKFFLPDKRPRKEIIVPPTKFLLGGNISDPLNLNSLQNEANSSNSNTPATTPRQSPITTPPKVEVIIPPNIHDPLHLLDPVDTVEYEKQLTSPLKRKSKSSKSKHRHRKKKTKRRRCDSTNLIIDEQADPQVSSCGSASTELFKDCAAPSDCCSSFSDGNLSAEYRAEVETNAGVYHENKDDDATNDTSSCRQVVNNVAQHLGDAEQAGEPNNHEFTTRVQAQVNSASKHEVGENKKSTNGISNSDRENVKKDLRLDLSGISTIIQHAHYGTVGSGPGSVSSCSGRKRKVSEGTCSAKNKFRRMDSMDKIVSPVVPQPGAWKRPPRVAPTGSRKLSRHRTSSHGDLDLLSPVDDAKTVTDTDSVRADTPDLDTNYKFTDAFSASSPLSVVSVNTSDNNVTTEKNSGSISAIENFDSSSKATKVPNFRADGAKYQYGNYDRYPTYRNFNELMDDVRLQVFLRNQELFQGKDILDIGCNVGHITIAVARNLGPKSVLGIDIDKNLIARARKNLSMYVTIPQAKTEQKNTHAKAKGVDSKDDKQQSNRRQKKKTLNHNQHVHIHHYHSHHMHPIQNQYSQKLFPVSFPLTYGPIPGTQGHLQSDPEPSSSANSVEFPKNVFFRQTNYVLKDETLLSNDAQQYDLILCLSVTKWIHLNFGDNGLKMAFKRIFNQLRPGGKLILEAQNWASYKKRKNLTETIYNNYKNIEFFPNKFHEYLLSNEVGFSHSYTLGVPRHMSKGFCRPIQLYAKGDFTPNHVRWSDAYYPQTPYEPYRGIYATMPRPPHPIPNAYETPGSYSVRQTPMHQPTSQYYNPLETDNYLPSYDIEFLNQLYVFASPLYQTVWSPPASMRNSSSHTPLFGSLRDLENEEGSGGNSIHRHVYPPNDETSSPNANGAFNSIREPDTDDSQAPSHVYANCDSSSSPHVNGYDTQEGLEEQPAAHRSSQGQNGCTDSNES